MQDLDKALADIFEIRSHIAAGMAFRGYGPAAMAVTSGLALLATVAQALWLGDATGRPLIFFSGWILAAILSAGVIGVETLARSRRHHSGLADAMIYQAIEQFLPSAAAGALLTAALGLFSSESLWLLPGLWQVLAGVGIFASARSLPRGVGLAGAWYFLAGFATLALGARSHALSPWTMGLPFVFGQLLLAVALFFASGEFDGET